MNFQKECFVFLRYLCTYLFFVLYIEEWGFIAPETRESKTGNMKEWKDADPAADHMPVTQSLSGIQS